MQDLLARISRLDPSASLGIRVIACFDELVVGNVNTHALLSAAASLAGCVAGFRQHEGARELRVDPRGRVAADRGDAARVGGDGHALVEPAPGLSVWLERQGEPLPNDAIILERLALAMRIRHGRGRDDGVVTRELAVLVASGEPTEAKAVAAASIGLQTDRRYRMVAAPLFAVWTSHPSAHEDVIATRYGPIHALVVPAEADPVSATPCGIGVGVDLQQLDHSFRTALVSLQLCDPKDQAPVTADEYGGLIGLLADAPLDSPQPDVERLELLARHAWGITTIDAIVRSPSVRQAARLVGVHHSTLQTRLDCITETVGFNPYEGFGRTRLGTAYLVWRLRHSRVLELPTPT